MGIIGVGVGLPIIRNAKRVIIDTFDGPELNPAWIAYGGSVWGIESGKLKIITSGGIRDTILMETTWANVAVECQLDSTDSRLSFRAIDHNNQLFFGNTSSSSVHQLYKVVDGTATVLGNSGITRTPGDVVRVVAIGDNIKCYVNDVLVLEVAESFNQTATKHGFTSFRTAGMLFDNFRAERM